MKHVKHVIEKKASFSVLNWINTDDDIPVLYSYDVIINDNDLDTTDTSTMGWELSSMTDTVWYWLKINDL